MSDKHFLLMYNLSADYPARRQNFRAAHLTLAQAAVERGELILGGAVQDPIDLAVLLFKGPTPAAAAAFAAADPYVRAGLVTAWRVRAWATTIGPDALTKV